jgi:hypothetical protein
MEGEGITEGKRLSTNITFSRDLETVGLCSGVPSATHQSRLVLFWTLVAFAFVYSAEVVFVTSRLSMARDLG